MTQFIDKINIRSKFNNHDNKKKNYAAKCEEKGFLLLMECGP